MKKFLALMLAVVMSAVMFAGCAAEEEIEVRDPKELYDTSLFEEDEPVGEPATINIDAFYKDSSDYGVENVTVKFTGEGFELPVVTDATGHFNAELPVNTALTVSVTDSTGAVICEGTFDVMTGYEEGYYSYKGAMELFVPEGTTVGYMTFFEKSTGVMGIAYESLAAADTTVKAHFIEDATVDEDGETIAE